MKRNYDDFGYAVALLNPDSMTGDGTYATGSDTDLKGCTKGVLIALKGDGWTGSLTYKFQHGATTGSGYGDHSAFSTGATLTGANKIAATEINDLKRYGRILYQAEASDTGRVGFVFVGWDATTQPLPS